MSIIPLHPAHADDLSDNATDQPAVDTRPASDNSRTQPNREIAALLLTDQQCADLCGCTRRTWRTWDARKITPASIKLAGSRRWRRADAERWIEWGCPGRDVFEARIAAEAAAKKGARR